MLEIAGLNVDLNTRYGGLRILDDVSLSVPSGEVLGVVGESGAGKSMTGAAVIGLLPPAARITAGVIRLDGRRIDNLDDAAMRRVRGREIGSIFQDPMSSLNPLFTVGEQIVETMRAHLTAMSRREATRRALHLLAAVGMPDPERRMRHYPHQFSGGMRQRIVIALALCASPRLVIADEPTTALDVSVQAQVLGLLKKLCREQGTAMLLITHDMGVIAEMADRVAVLYAGRVVEVGDVHAVLRKPLHPYTKGLIGSIPRLGARQRRLTQIKGTMPRLGETPSECCPFSGRCPEALGVCTSRRPPESSAAGSRVACWQYEGHDLEVAQNG
jgi:peptide/nickel transport system ATP-binding protein